MHFWNVNKLIDLLRENKVTESGFKNYYIASSILIFFSYLALTLTPESSATEAWASFILQVGLLISWINAIFKANGGEHGRDFLKRFIALYLPVTIQSLVIFIAIAVVIEALLPMLTVNMDEAALKQFTTIKDLSFEVIISCYIYWRIFKAIKRINQPQQS
ncbi:hypothetical protein B9T33_05470 [Acinetobacter sp. ANC 5054]|uniref:hypothetical protein n=1 Tax=Acinetobacter sp. ANC 5054 TaxID=1977877 RepID=UPI000A34851F|nr:hypothetical protein [Acinetobacter sp. ANC 5054]OTG81974.1 hypothetical protein B9T33_05470 [Acinetobacter sp. ANC 5054]